MLLAKQHFDPRAAPLAVAAPSPGPSHAVDVRNVIAGFDCGKDFAQGNSLADANHHGEAFDPLGLLFWGFFGIVSHHVLSSDRH